MSIQTDEFKEKKLIEEKTSFLDLEKLPQTINTLKDGDCAFHAILGEWNEKEGVFIYSKTIDKRNQLKNSIKGADKKSEIYRYIKEGIQNLIMTGNYSPDNKAMLELSKKYQDFSSGEEKNLEKAWGTFEIALKKYPDIMAHIKKNHGYYQEASLKKKFESLISEEDDELTGLIFSIPELQTAFEKYETEKDTQTAWEAFETVLTQHPEIVEHINQNHTLYQEVSLKHQFQSALSKKEGLLQALILSIPELQMAFEEYNQKCWKGFDWDKEINTEVIDSYAEHIAKPKTWMLPVELAMIAYVFKRKVIYYPYPGSEPQVFGSSELIDDKDNSVYVQFDGIGHFERLMTLSDPLVYKSPKLSLHILDNLIAHVLKDKDAKIDPKKLIREFYFFSVNVALIQSLNPKDKKIIFDRLKKLYQLAIKDDNEKNAEALFNEETLFKDHPCFSELGQGKLKDEKGNNLWHLAAKNGNLDLLKTLDKNDKNLLLTNQEDKTPIELAAQHGHLNVVEYLISECKAIKFVHQKELSEKAFNLLVCACQGGHIKLVNYLLELISKQGLKKPLESYDWASLISEAAQNEQPDLIKHLVQTYKVNVNRRDHGEEYPLQRAIDVGAWKSAAYLLDLATFKPWADSMHIAIIYRDWTTLTFLLTEKHVPKINIPYDGEKTLLDHAIEHGNLKVIQYLAEKCHPASIEKALLVTYKNKCSANIMEYFQKAHGLKVALNDFGKAYIIKTSIENKEKPKSIVKEEKTRVTPVVSHPVLHPGLQSHGIFHPPISPSSKKFLQSFFEAVPDVTQFLKAKLKEVLNLLDAYFPINSDDPSIFRKRMEYAEQLLYYQAKEDQLMPEDAKNLDLIAENITKDFEKMSIESHKKTLASI